MTVGTSTRPFRHGLSAYRKGKCRCEECRREVQLSDRTRRHRAREERRTMLAAQLVASGVRTFYGIRCSACGAGLHDENGQPRWDILWPLRFVCRNGCKAGAR